MDTKTGTPFLTIYNSFLNRVTSEMYMEMTELDTFEQLQGILLNAKEELDVYVPSKNFAVEYDGLFWHSEK